MEVEMFSHFQSALIRIPRYPGWDQLPNLLFKPSHGTAGLSESHGRDRKQEGTGQQTAAMQDLCCVLPWFSPFVSPVMLNYNSRDDPACCGHKSNTEMTAPPWWYLKSWLIWKLRQGGRCLFVFTWVSLVLVAPTMPPSLATAAKSLGKIQAKPVRI